MRAILVDDEQSGLSSLQRLLDLHCPEVEIVHCARNADEAIMAIEQHTPELVFLDIAMPGKSGFEMLQEIPDIKFEIIFVTAYNRYILQALHLSAVDYLLKPVDEKLLIDAVKRAETRIEKRTERMPMETFLHNIQQPGPPNKLKFCIPSAKGFQVIDIQKIVYIEASSNYSNFHFIDRSVVCASKTIHEFATLLADCNFVRVHKSYVVNLDHVLEYVRGEGGNVILSGGKEIEVSRRKKEELMKRMKEYFKQ
ncbi:MAG: LytTR family DNA-binding domain-containing protein [Saprospiraceae bacterium]